MNVRNIFLTDLSHLFILLCVFIFQLSYKLAFPITSMYGSILARNISAEYVEEYKQRFKRGKGARYELQGSYWHKERGDIVANCIEDLIKIAEKQENKRKGKLYCRYQP